MLRCRALISVYLVGTLDDKIMWYAPVWRNLVAVIVDLSAKHQKQAIPPRDFSRTEISSSGTPLPSHDVLPSPTCMISVLVSPDNSGFPAGGTRTHSLFPPPLHIVILKNLMTMMMIAFKFIITFGEIM